MLRKRDECEPTRCCHMHANIASLHPRKPSEASKGPDHPVYLLTPICTCLQSIALAQALYCPPSALSS